MSVLFHEDQSTIASGQFQFTHLREVRLAGLFSSLISLVFQFTHLREVRLKYLPKDDRLNDISIHAPT
jgi:hypothetical protein